MVAAREEHKTRQKERNPKKAAAVEPAVAEEGKSKGFWHNMRGGGAKTSMSYDSYDKEDAYYEEPMKRRFWTKRKICKYSTRIIPTFARL